MINGYERLFQDGGKYKYPFPENLHGAWQGVQSRVGYPSNEMFAALIEQQVGRDNYTMLMQCHATYKEVVEKAVAFKQTKQLEEQRKKELHDQQAAYDAICSDIDAITQKGAKNTDEKDDERLAQLLASKKEAKARLDQLNSQIVHANSDELRDALGRLDELVNAIKSTGVLESKGVKKFDDPSFRQEMVQDFVDGMLLPGDEKKEQGMRDVGNAEFDIAEGEMHYLKEAIENSEELLDHISEHKSVELPDEMVDKYKYVCAQERLTTSVMDAPFSYNPDTAKGYSYIYKTAFKPATDPDYDQTFANFYGEIGRVVAGKSINLQSKKSVRKSYDMLEYPYLKALEVAEYRRTHALTQSKNATKAAQAAMKISGAHLAEPGRE